MARRFSSETHRVDLCSCLVSPPGFCLQVSAFTAGVDFILRLVKFSFSHQILNSTRERASLVAQSVKTLPAVQETWVRSLGQEDPLEKETAPHSCIVAWKIPWTEVPGGLQSMEPQRVGHD